MDYDMGNILLYDEAFTARPLSRCLRAAFRHLYESHQHVVTEIDSICTRFDKIINIRNDIVHGQTVWYSSVEVDEDDRDYISRQLAEVGAKRKVGRTGIVIRQLPEFEALAGLIRDIKSLESRLRTLATSGTHNLSMDAPSFLGQRQKPG